MFQQSRAHKRFTELLDRNDRQQVGSRVPLNKICTLPELKVSKNIRNRFICVSGDITHDDDDDAHILSMGQYDKLKQVY